MESIPDHVPSELVIPFDFRQDPRLRTDPYGFFHSANDLPEIFYSPDLGGHWVLARAALIEEAYQRPDLFSNRTTNIPKIEGIFQLIPEQLRPAGAPRLLADSSCGRCSRRESSMRSSISSGS